MVGFYPTSGVSFFVTECPLFNEAKLYSVKVKCDKIEEILIIGEVVYVRTRELFKKP